LPRENRRITIRDLAPPNEPAADPVDVQSVIARDPALPDEYSMTPDINASFQSRQVLKADLADIFAVVDDLLKVALPVLAEPPVSFFRVRAAESLRYDLQTRAEYSSFLESPFGTQLREVWNPDAYLPR
jgi:hypothetical protein